MAYSNVKIGMLSLNFSWHGEATSAASWTTHLKNNGYDVELFSFSRSGKKIKRMRTDYEFTCLKSKDEAACLEFLDSKDVIVSFGTGLPGEDPDRYPDYVNLLASMRTPLIIYIPTHPELLLKTYRHSEQLLYIAQGFLFLRDSIRKHCYESYSNIFQGRPYHIAKCPVSMQGVKPTRKETNRLVCATRITPVKRLKQILQAVRDHNLTTPFDIWGDTGDSRYGYLLSKEFGDLFLDRYRGPYTHEMLDRIYAPARFCFDMTNVYSDGGVQHSYLEAMKRSVVPIVPAHWNVVSSCVTASNTNASDIAAAVEFAVSMSEDDRLSLIERGHTYIRENHDPFTVTKGFTEYAAAVVGRWKGGLMPSSLDAAPLKAV